MNYTPFRTFMGGLSRDRILTCSAACATVGSAAPGRSMLGVSTAHRPKTMEERMRASGQPSVLEAVAAASVPRAGGVTGVVLTVTIYTFSVVS